MLLMLVVSARASGEQVHIFCIFFTPPGASFSPQLLSLPKHTTLPFLPIHPVTMPANWEWVSSHRSRQEVEQKSLPLSAYSQTPWDFHSLRLRIRGWGTLLVMILIALPSVLLAKRNPILFRVSKLLVQIFTFSDFFLLGMGNKIVTENYWVNFSKVTVSRT